MINLYLAKKCWYLSDHMSDDMVVLYTDTWLIVRLPNRQRNRYVFVFCLSCGGSVIIVGVE